MITGISGGEWGVRGFLAAYDINTGKQVWKAYSTGPDAEMLIDPDKTMTWTDGKMAAGRQGLVAQDLAGRPVEDRRRHDLGLVQLRQGAEPVYYGTGNPSTWNPAQRPGDNKWSMTIFARDVDTGMAKWAYQMTPYDEWDFDGVNEMILADINVKGKPTKALVHFDRNGFGYTLDRATGELLVAEKYDPTVNWATHVDMKTGRPQSWRKYSHGEERSRRQHQGHLPGGARLKDQQPAAFNPKNSLFYVPTNHVCMDYEPFKVEYTAGQPYVGATLSMYPGAGQPRRHGQLHRLGCGQRQDRPVEAREVLGVERRADDRRRHRVLRHARGLPEVRRRQRHQQGAVQVQDAVRNHRQRVHL